MGDSFAFCGLSAPLHWLSLALVVFVLLLLALLSLALLLLALLFQNLGLCTHGHDARQNARSEHPPTGCWPMMTARMVQGKRWLPESLIFSPASRGVNHVQI